MFLDSGAQILDVLLLGVSLISLATLSPRLLKSHSALRNTPQENIFIIMLLQHLSNTNIMYWVAYGWTQWPRQQAIHKQTNKHIQTDLTITPQRHMSILYYLTCASFSSTYWTFLRFLTETSEIHPCMDAKPSDPSHSKTATLLVNLENWFFT